jgi:hypothetical protein
MATFGTNTTLDTLAASQQTIAQFGEDRASVNSKRCG